MILFEVTSKSSQRLDLGGKAEKYREIASVQRYVVLDQDRIAAVVFSRAGREWKRSALGEGAVMELPEIGVVVQLAEIYRGVDLASEGKS